MGVCVEEGGEKWGGGRELTAIDDGAELRDVRKVGLEARVGDVGC